MSIAKSVLLASWSVVTLAGAAHAADSSWLVCKGVADTQSGADKAHIYLAASVLEHRGSDGSSRDLEVSLLRGAHVATATVVGKVVGTFTDKPAAVKLVADKKPAFTGTVQLASDFSSIAFAGALDVSFGADPKTSTMQIKAKLTCEQLDDLAIGH